MNFAGSLTLPIAPEGTQYVSLTNDYGVQLGQVATGRDGRRFRFARTSVALPDPGTIVSPDATYIGGATFSAFVFTPTVPFRHGLFKYRLTSVGGVMPGSPFAANAFGALVVRPTGLNGAMVHNLAAQSAIPGTANPTIDIELPRDDGFAPNEPLGTACALVGSKYSNLVVAGSAASGGAANTPVSGVFVLPMPAGGYGWMQVGGPCVVIANAAITRGQAVKLSATPSQVTPIQTVGNAPLDQTLGYAYADAAAGGLALIELRIP